MSKLASIARRAFQNKKNQIHHERLAKRKKANELIEQVQNHMLNQDTRKDCWVIQTPSFLRGIFWENVTILPGLLNHEHPLLLIEGFTFVVTPNLSAAGGYTLSLLLRRKVPELNPTTNEIEMVRRRIVTREIHDESDFAEILNDPRPRLHSDFRVNTSINTSLYYGEPSKPTKTRHHTPTYQAAILS